MSSETVALCSGSALPIRETRLQKDCPKVWLGDPEQQIVRREFGEEDQNLMRTTSLRVSLPLFQSKPLTA